MGLLKTIKNLLPSAKKKEEEKTAGATSQSSSTSAKSSTKKSTSTKSTSAAKSGSDNSLATALKKDQAARSSKTAKSSATKSSTKLLPTASEIADTPKAGNSTAFDVDPAQFKTTAVKSGGDNSLAAALKKDTAAQRSAKTSGTKTGGSSTDGRHLAVGKTLVTLDTTKAQEQAKDRAE